MNIELGCGGNKNPGFKGLDKRPGPGVDIVCDLEEGIPLPDNSVDLVSASHILEHITNIMGLMDEIYRVCKPNASIAICVPHYKSIGAWQDPTHVRPFTEYTFFYWDPRHDLYKIYKTKAKFLVTMCEWTTLGNLEVILIADKGRKDLSLTQKEALYNEGICAEDKKEATNERCGKKTKPAKKVQSKRGKEIGVGRQSSKGKKRNSNS